MIKNRIRTAALAGAVAVATGVSGLAVPAMAQDSDDLNVTNAQYPGEGFNEEDGSAEVDVDAENIGERELRDRTNATAEYLRTNEGSIIEIITEYVDAAQDGFDPSEEAARNLFDSARAEATGELATSAENITAARASVAYALEVDKAAEEAWDALQAAINNAAGAVNPLITAVNDANRHAGANPETGEEYFPEIEQLSTNIDDPKPAQAWRELLALQIEVNRQLDLAGQWAIDEDEDRYVTREHVEALDALKAEVDSRVEAIQSVYDEAVAANLEAQRSDVLVRQLFLERATAQRDTLRVIESIFSTAARFAELYESNENATIGDTTLRALYRDVLFGDLVPALGENLDLLVEADTAAEDFFLVWETDLGNNDDEDQYEVEKREFAAQTYANMVRNSEWQEALAWVQLQDDAIQDAVRERQERQEAERIAAEKAAEEAREAAERAERIADALEELANAGNNNDDDNDDNGNNDDDKNNDEGSSVGNLGIFAVLAGVIGLIAAAFPFVSNFLNR